MNTPEIKVGDIVYYYSSCDNQNTYGYVCKDPLLKVWCFWAESVEKLESKIKEYKQGREFNLTWMGIYQVTLYIPPRITNWRKEIENG